ncbi:MAG TPA: alpha/beta fold hydrolase [Terriglobia bacterium]|nr:alpha/beta fold hydrolase [Terriglobia bacterium]
MTHQQESGRAIARDGAALHYTLHGKGRLGLPRIVLVHSLGMSEAVWEGVVERLVPQACVLTYDCRGHGLSAKPPGPYRLEQFANDLNDLLTHVGWSSAYVAGASLGGSVALQCAILYPGRVQGLGLIDTTAWYGPEAKERWEWRAREAEEKGLPSLIEFQLSRWFSDEFRQKNPEAVARCRAIFLANDVASFAASCRMLGDFDLRARLAGIRCPTVIVVGEEDYATPPEMARVLESGIAGAILKIIPKARHLTFVEHPAVIAELLSQLVQMS